MKDNIQTNRLIFRELLLSDLDNLQKVLSEKESMQFYPKPFSREEVINWINWNMKSYQENGFGLWALIIKETKEFIGECGITIQDIEGVKKLEIGYHLLPQYRGQGYATEAAKACIEYAFKVLKINKICSYMSKENIPSQKVAERNGMHRIKEFTKKVMGQIVIEVLYELENQNGI